MKEGSSPEKATISVLRERWEQLVSNHPPVVYGRERKREEVSFMQQTKLICSPVRAAINSDLRAKAVELQELRKRKLVASLKQAVGRQDCDELAPTKSKLIILDRDVLVRNPVCLPTTPVISEAHFVDKFRPLDVDNVCHTVVDENLSQMSPPLPPPPPADTPSMLDLTNIIPASENVSQDHAMQLQASAEKESPEASPAVNSTLYSSEESQQTRLNSRLSSVFGGCDHETDISDIPGVEQVASAHPSPLQVALPNPPSPATTPLTIVGRDSGDEEYSVQKHAYYSRRRIGDYYTNRSKRPYTLDQNALGAGSSQHRQNLSNMSPRVKNIQPSDSNIEIESLTQLTRLDDDTDDFHTEMELAALQNNTQHASMSEAGDEEAVCYSDCQRSQSDLEGEVEAADLSTPRLRAVRRSRGSLSREANALLDMETFSTPLKHSAADGLAGRQIGAVTAAGARRRARMLELPNAIQMEKRALLEATSQVTQMVNARVLAPNNSKEVRDCWANLRVCKKLLISCQRHQSLVEELALLDRGGPVLVPPSHGEPLKARLLLAGIRISLKTAVTASSVLSDGFAVVRVGSRCLLGGGELEEILRLQNPFRYHLIAILKCVGEGRLFHSEVVTLMKVTDLPVGTAKAATHVVLPTNIEIAPLQPEFLIRLEIYCMTEGIDNSSDLIADVGGGNYTKSANRTHRTPKLRRIRIPRSIFLSRSVNRVKALSRLTCGFVDISPSIIPTHKSSNKQYAKEHSSAFTFLSSIDFRHHDSLLFGQFLSQTEASPDGNMSIRNGLPLILPNLSSSSPLAGAIGFVNISIRLQSTVVKRGFLTVFEEAGGFGCWQRYWCQLRADRLTFWSCPEGEEEESSREGRSKWVRHIDLRRVVSPWAVEAPPAICARANTIYLRSIASVDAFWLASALEVAPAQGDQQSRSLILRASTDCHWLEQKHLLCADTAADRAAWMTAICACLSSMHLWMPEHYSCLERYDARLKFTHTVPASLTPLLNSDSFQEET